MKKIAILGTDVTVLGGIERVIAGLAKSFRDSGKYSVVVVSVFSSKGTMYYPLSGDVRIIHLSLSRMPEKHFKRKLQYAKMMFILSKLCKTEKIDILIGTRDIINIVLPFVRNCRVKIATEHLPNTVASLYWKTIKKILYPMLHCLVCLTNADAKNYSYVKNVKIVPNQMSFMPSKQSELKNKIILAVGRLVREKGFDTLIEIIFEIKEKCDGWQIRIVGGDGRDGEYEKKLKEQIKNLKLDNIITIFPATDNIIAEYTNAGIFVMPSRYEGFGLVLVEAMTCGLPVVSFDCPEGPADIVQNNEDGFLVENGNNQAFADALLKLMQDEDLRRNFGPEAAKNMIRFSPENIFRMWDSLFEELVNGE